jgi:predicted site-specific integrase-resolvase
MTTNKTYAPKVLADEIGVDPKVLRSYLRKTFTRPVEVKNTTWIIDENVANDCREYFAARRAAKAESVTA